MFTGKGQCSKDACCETFPGDKPFSEKESTNVANYLSNRSSELAAFLDIHSYSQMWLSPWGWMDGTPVHYNQMVSGLTKLTMQKVIAWQAATPIFVLKTVILLSFLNKVVLSFKQLNTGNAPTSKWT